MVWFLHMFQAAVAFVSCSNPSPNILRTDMHERVGYGALSCEGRILRDKLRGQIMLWRKPHTGSNGTKSIVRVGYHLGKMVGNDGIEPPTISV
ncbi:hypothetical protein APA386B_568 [Acetobacter pasteurianus 386B]|nr:hypothetical protein APA386B_568 [Acetobacter pasteurianus 386B]